MTTLKTLARILPPPLRSTVRDIWRKLRGNPEFAVLRLLAERERIAIDVGANYGTYTLILAKLANECVAFEPNPPLAAATGEAAAANGLTNVRVEACALSDEDGEIIFRVPIVDGVESAALATIEENNRLDGADVRSYTVPRRRLDSFAFDPVGLMKIDAEGHETAILDGARALIERDHPAVMIEVEERHKKGSVDYVRRFFTGYGYQGYFLHGRRIVPIDRFDLASYQNPADIEHETVRLDAVYVNNFIFAADPRRVALLDEAARTNRSL